MIRKTFVLVALLASASLMVQACAAPGENGETAYRLTTQELAMLKDGSHAHKAFKQGKQMAAKKNARNVTLAKNNTKRIQSVLFVASNNQHKPKAVKPLQSILIAHKQPAKKQNALAFASVVSNKELTKVRGTFSPTDFDWTLLTANNRNNAVTGTSMTGANFVTDSAFNNASGLVNVIQNSGNNVIIQSATIVNLTMQ